MDPEDAAYWTGHLVVQTLLPHCGRTPLATPAQPQCWKDEIPWLWHHQTWGIWRAGGNPSCCCCNSWHGISFLNVKQNAPSKFCIMFNFHGNIFYLFGAVKKPPKCTITFIYKLDRKRLCIHSLTNHLSKAENFICQENYENRNCVQKYKYLYSLQGPHSSTVEQWRASTGYWVSSGREE